MITLFEDLVKRNTPIHYDTLKEIDKLISDEVIEILMNPDNSTDIYLIEKKDIAVLNIGYGEKIFTYEYSKKKNYSTLDLLNTYIAFNIANVLKDTILFKHRRGYYLYQSHSTVIMEYYLFIEEDLKKIFSEHILKEYLSDIAEEVLYDSKTELEEEINKAMRATDRCVKRDIQKHTGIVPSKIRDPLVKAFITHRQLKHEIKKAKL